MTTCVILPKRWLRSEMSCTDSGLSHRPSTNRVEGASDTEEQDTVPTSSLSSNSCTAAQCPHQPDGDNAVYSPGCHRGEMNDNRAATQWLLSIVLKRQLTWRFPLTASFDLMFISQGLSQMDVGSGFLSLSPVIWVSWCRHTVSQVKRKCLTVLVSPGPSATKMSRSGWQQRWEGLIFMRHLQGTGAEDMRPGQCCSSPDGFLECWVWSGLSVAPEETMPDPFIADSIKSAMPALLRLPRLRYECGMKNSQKKPSCFSSKCWAIWSPAPCSEMCSNEALLWLLVLFLILCSNWHIAGLFPSFPVHHTCPILFLSSLGFKCESKSFRAYIVHVQVQSLCFSRASHVSALPLTGARLNQVDVGER